MTGRKVIRDEELKPELVPYISDGESKIQEFAITIESFDTVSFIKENAKLLREGEFKNIRTARKVLYSIFWFLHGNMQDLDEDEQIYAQTEKALQFIRGYAWRLQRNK